MAFMLAFAVILLGAYTRLTNAGLSCPDWPNCFGYVTAPHTLDQLQGAAARYPNIAVDVKKAWTEMTHRYFAGTEGILILILAVMTLVKRPTRGLSFIAIALITLLGVQVMLGMLTVTEKLQPVIVLGHLLTGLSLLSGLWLLYLLGTQSNKYYALKRPYLLPWLWLGLFCIIGQITLGGWVSTHYAGLACIDLPYCNGQLLPPLHLNALNTDLITIHMLHRLGALITFSYVAGLALFLVRFPLLRALAIQLLALLALQLTLGIFNVIWLRPVWIALIHHAVAIFLLLTMITVLVKAYFGSEDNRYGSWPT